MDDKDLEIVPCRTVEVDRGDEAVELPQELIDRIFGRKADFVI